MAITISTNKADTEATATDAATAAGAPIEITKLTLAIYQRYSRGGILYEAGKVYGFTAEQAETLLAEEDEGRPIWRKYRAPKVEDSAASKEPEVIIQTERELPVLNPVEVVNGRLEVGTEDELKELGLPGDGKGDDGGESGPVVTV
jgi:hypothetical protein